MTGPSFQAESTNNTPCDHWWRILLYSEVIFSALFKYRWNPSFLIALWLPLETTCTGTSKVSWKVFLNIPGKNPSISKTIIFEVSNGTKKFPKAHCVTWYGVIYFSPVAAPIPNPVIKDMNVRILRDPSQSGMSSIPEKSRNITSNEVSGVIVWNIYCASKENEYTNWLYAQALMNWSKSLITIGHQNRSIILNKVLWSWLFPASGETWHADITTHLKLTGTTISLIFPTLAVNGVL